MVEQDLERLRQGLPPTSPQLLEQLLVGRQMWYETMCEHYLDGLIRAGGSAVKWLIGSEGAGKSHHLTLLAHAARQRGYLVVVLDASETRLQYFHDLYGSIVRGIGVEHLVSRYTDRLIAALGHEPKEIPSGTPFLVWAQEVQGHEGEALKRELRQRLEELFRNGRLDSSFATAFVHLCLHRLGVRPLAEEGYALLSDWMQAVKVPVIALRRFHLFTRIDRYNARSMFHSLLEIARQVGAAGLLVAIDRLEVLTQRREESGRLLYTRPARDDTYESLRQLVDATDTLEGTLFVLAARRPLLDQESTGLKSYSALWLRLQREVASDRPDRFNRFADLVDLDLAQAAFLTATDYRPLVDRLANFCLECGMEGKPPDEATIQQVAGAEGAVAPLRRLVQLTMGGFTRGREVLGG